MYGNGPRTFGMRSASPSRRGSSRAILALAALFGCGSAARANGISFVQPSTGYYLGENPEHLGSWNELKPAIRESLIAHLRQRLGGRFFALLTFEACHHRQAPPPEGGSYCAYQIEFVLKVPAIDRYQAMIALREDGSVLKEIDLPACDDGSLPVFLPEDRARAWAISQGPLGENCTAYVSFSESRNCLSWVYEDAPESNPHAAGLRVRRCEVFMRAVPEVEVRYSSALTVVPRLDPSRPAQRALPALALGPAAGDPSQERLGVRQAGLLGRFLERAARCDLASNPG